VHSSLSDEEPMVVRPLSEESIAGYALLEDIYGTPGLVLRVDMPREIHRQGKASVSFFLLSLLAVGLAFGLVSLWHLEKYVLSRLTRLSRSVSDIGTRGDLSARVAVAGADELSSLAEAINGMLEKLERSEKALKGYSERLEEMVKQRTDELQKAYDDLRDSQAKLIQSEKLAATGRLAASVAHEINNPLQGISNYLAVISRQVAEEDPLHEDLEMVKLGFERISEIVRRLRAFYRPIGEEMEPTDINGVVERVLALVGYQLSLGNIEVNTEMAERDLPVLGSAGQLEQVLVNLVLNAQEAMPQGGELTVRTTLHEGVVQLQVSDTGHGISEEEMSRLFKPFYSGKGGTGLGLGLWISYNIIEGHGGSIEVESQVDEGTTFTIHLPAYQRER
jgi:two-component system NtrC family sensor kinase